VTPSQKISVIERSLRSCRYGYLSLIPIGGLVAFILAFRDISFVRKTCGKEWNPASARLKLGIALAIIGLIVSIATICFIIYPPFDKQNSNVGQYDYE
jgi:hypothetical protein